MTEPRQRRPQLKHALRVAAVATLLIGCVYVVFVAVFDVIDAHRLVAQVDAGLSEKLLDTSHNGNLLAHPGKDDADDDVDAAPIVLWLVGSDGTTQALSDGAPSIPRGSWGPSDRPANVQIGSSTFRLVAMQTAGGWLVAGQSLADIAHVERVLLTAEVIAGPVLVLAMFVGALAVGLKASGPLEQMRRRQLEFTADASHELRTPLSVIEAEAGLALSIPRDASEYRDSLERIEREGHRLRRIVEDLLWLARFDSEPPPPGDEPVDVATIARMCADRFGAVARSRGIDLSVRYQDDSQTWVNAPPEWIDRLAGVLVDNACHYSGMGGTVRVVVATSSNRVSLAVEDSGPGIPAEERPRLFDRFHRATDQGIGAGLGLAIGDSVVSSTGGRWRVGDSELGGARMEVIWPRARIREVVPVRV